MNSQLLVVHGASTPEIASPFGGLVFVLFSPCVLAPSERISNRIRTGSRSSLLLVIPVLMLSSLFSQPLLDFMLVSFLRLLFLLSLLGGLFVPFLSCNAI